MAEERGKSGRDAGVDGREVSRTGQRARVLKSALASFNFNFSAVPCVVRNLSDSGARLEFADPTLVPPAFELHVEMDGFKVQCKRVWTEGRQCGVEFVSQRQPTRVHRAQVLGSSQNALSENTVRELRARERHAANSRPVPDPDAGKPRPPARGPSFGQRR